MVDNPSQPAKNTGTKKTNEVPAVTPITPGQTLPMLSRLLSHNYFKKCPICSHQFNRRTDDIEIYAHVENCITSSEIADKNHPESNYHFCPNCKQKIPGNDVVYIEHLTECLNEHNDN